MIDVDAIARAMFPAHVAGEADVAPTASTALGLDRACDVQRAPVALRAAHDGVLHVASSD